MTYTTVLGDTWDKIAKEVYGNELYAGYLMKHNYHALDIFVFSAGTVLNIPELKEEDTTDLPPWRE